MATIAAPAARPLVSRFYVTMAAIFVAIAFGGFFETYWLQLARGTFVEASPLLHLHGLLFSFWTLFFLSQALLVANRKVRSHRAGVCSAYRWRRRWFSPVLQWRSKDSSPDFSKATATPRARFMLVPVSAILLFAGFVAAAIVNVRRPEWHKRLMLVATTALLQAAVARFFFVAVDWRRARAAARSRAAARLCR